MPYTHTREGHSDFANGLADELCDLLNRLQAEAVAERLRQIEAGTAPPLPWQFSIMDVAYFSQCANSMDVVLSERNPEGKRCPSCREVHPRGD